MTDTLIAREPAATRCTSTYPGAATLRGRAIRCDAPAGHDGEHGNSFAARYWADDPCEVCGRSGRDARRCAFGNPRGLCSCWRGEPCNGR